MSFDALAWAAKQNTGSPGTKLILLGLAECASRDGALAYPSTAALVEFSSLDRKSVIANLDRLQTAGLITDTGDRVGQTKQIKVYRLNLETVPKTEPSQNRNSSAFSAKGSQKRDTELVKEPVSSVKGANAPSTPRAKFPAPPGVSDPQWKAFRKQRKKALNERSYALLSNKLRELAEAGYPPGDMIDLAIERGWETVFKPREQRNGTPQPVGSLRGTRPDPALDLYRAGRAAEEAEREDDHPDWRAWPAIQSFRPS